MFVLVDEFLIALFECLHCLLIIVLLLLQQIWANFGKRERFTSRLKQCKHIEEHFYPSDYNHVLVVPILKLVYNVFFATFLKRVEYT